MTENAGRETDYEQVVKQITKELQTASADTLKVVLQSSLQQVICVVGAESGSIWFYDKENREIIYPFFWIGDADLTGLSLSVGEGVAGIVVECGEPLVIKDCKKDERWAERFDQQTGFKTKSMICVPLKSVQEVIGCIQIINKKDGSLYHDKDVCLCEKLAALMAEAIHNNPPFVPKSADH